jgi:hypothetical protein
VDERSNLICSLDGFVRAVLQNRDTWDPGEGGTELWFRGVKRSSFSLLPGAYWRTPCDEESLFLSFRAATPSYVMQRPADDWEWYFLAQHYDLPTRLLDWTESPLTALYFALTETGGSCVSANTEDPPAVWVMDPAQLNALTHRKKKGYVYVPLSSKFRAWLPTECGRSRPIQSLDADADLIDNAHPIAIYPVRHNPRIVAQRGVFTVHGVNEVPIDKLIEERIPEAEIRIGKITIDPVACRTLLRDLTAMGINQTTLFPEPASVASDLKRHYGVA